MMRRRTSPFRRSIAVVVRADVQIDGSMREIPRASRLSWNRNQADVLSPPISLMDSKTFCPSRRMAVAAVTGMVMTFLASRFSLWSALGCHFLSLPASSSIPGHTVSVPSGPVSWWFRWAGR